MKASWTQDLNPFRYSGGAGLTDRAMIEAGMRRGHQIDLVIAEDGAPAVDDESDVFVVSNCTAFGQDYFKKLAATGKPVVFYFHDYTCRWRLFFPMEAKCRQCYLRERWAPVFDQAALFVWLSPLHREMYLHVYPELAEKPYAVIPSPVDPTKFFDMGQPRDGVLVVNGLQAFKGRQNVLDWAVSHPQTAVRVAGSDQQEGLPENVTCLGLIPPQQMNALYNQHEAVLLLPATPQPFERVAAEARMAGCNVIVNELVGAASYPWFTDVQQLREQCAAAPMDFWAALEKLVAK